MAKKILKARIVPNRDEKYMGLAFMVAGFSKDPATQVGAVIVAKDNYPLGFGYNGPPRNINDAKIDWSRPNKYKYIRHAEENAIDHSDQNKLKGSTLYVTAKPCPNCMLTIVSKKIERVIYFSLDSDSNSSLSDKNKIRDTQILSKDGNVKLIKFNYNLNWIRDHIMFLEYLEIFNT